MGGTGGARMVVVVVVEGGARGGAAADWGGRGGDEEDGPRRPGGGKVSLDSWRRPPILSLPPLLVSPRPAAGFPGSPHRDSKNTI